MNRSKSVTNGQALGRIGLFLDERASRKLGAKDDERPPHTPTTSLFPTLYGGMDEIPRLGGWHLFLSCSRPRALPMEVSGAKLLIMAPSTISSSLSDPLRLDKAVARLLLAEHAAEPEAVTAVATPPSGCGAARFLTGSRAAQTGLRSPSAGHALPDSSHAPARSSPLLTDSSPRLPDSSLEAASFVTFAKNPS